MKVPEHPHQNQAKENEFMLIGVFPTNSTEQGEMPLGAPAGFVYSIDAPVNVWCSTTASDGGSMSHEFCAMALNQLLKEEITPDSTATFVTDAGATLTWWVDAFVPKEEVQAYQAQSDQVRVVRIVVS